MTDPSSDPLDGLPKPKTVSQRSPLNTPSEPGGERWWLRESLGPVEATPEPEQIIERKTDTHSGPESETDQLEGVSPKDEIESSPGDRLHENTSTEPSEVVPDEDDTPSSSRSNVIPFIAIVSVTVVLWLVIGHVWGVGVGLALGGGYLFSSKGQDNA